VSNATPTVLTPRSRSNASAAKPTAQTRFPYKSNSPSVRWAVVFEDALIHLSMPPAISELNVGTSDRSRPVLSPRPITRSPDPYRMGPTQYTVRVVMGGLYLTSATSLGSNIGYMIASGILRGLIDSSMTNS